ncbi:MAG TPA: OmpA family protein [Gemmatimonadales bacterium]|nr:OmpA family protein [Gemmatimonadales bacterium]
MTFARPRAALIGAVALAIVFAPQPAEAQLGGLSRKIKERVQGTSRPAEVVPAAAEAAGAPPAGSAAREVWANFDFIPGQRTLFFADFTDEEVGNFPRRLEFKTGSMEVVELDGQRALKASSPSGFVIPLPEVLPARFTVEIDVINRNDRSTAAPTIKIYGGTAARTDVDVERTRLTFGHNGWDVSGGGTETEASFTSEETEAYMGHPVSVRVLGDGPYLKLYADGRRLANVPNANFMRGRGLFIAMEGRDGETGAVFITRVRVAESEKPVYEALVAAGRWATQGIFFDTGKSSLRAESAPTLKAIAAALSQHPDLRIRIEGHTDNVGNAAANLALSEARAAAVKAALVRDHDVKEDRLETAGLGDTKPVADNGSAEGRSSNRRVEVVKL